MPDQPSERRCPACGKPLDGPQEERCTCPLAASPSGESATPSAGSSEFELASPVALPQPKPVAPPGQPQPEEAQRFPIDSQLGSYTIRSAVIQGGMGEVMKASYDELLNTEVALKIMRRELIRNEEAKQLFLNEAKRLRHLVHDNIVKVMESGEDKGKGVLYLAMEYLEGWNLDQLVQKFGRQSPADACELVRQAAEGLDFIHDKGLIHRDIKPANLMWNRKDRKGEPMTTWLRSNGLTPGAGTRGLICIRWVAPSITSSRESRPSRSIPIARQNARLTC